MQKLWLRSMLLSLSWSMVFILFSPTIFAEKNDTAVKTVAGIPLEVKSAILLEASSGQILYQSNADIPYPPASMSKMMTEFIVMDEIKEGNLTWDDEVLVSQIAQDTGGSKVFLAAGESYTVKQLFIAMAVGSANDATVALAVHIAGTEEEFAKKMNEKAIELELKNAHFINATGLGRRDMQEGNRPQTIKGETVMSARDAAFLALAIQSNHPDFMKVSSLPSYQFRKRDDKPIINYNWMVEGNKDIPTLRSYAYEGLDGMKTGFTDEAGYCFTGTAEREGRRLISVVMGTASEEKRFTETKKLLDYGFNQFERKTVLSENSKLQGYEKVRILKGKQKEVDLETDRSIDFVFMKGTTPQLKITADINGREQLIAPIKRGTVLGKATITYKTDGGQNHLATVNLIAGEDVEKAGWFSLFLQAVGGLFSAIWKFVVGIF